MDHLDGVGMGGEGRGVGRYHLRVQCAVPLQYLSLQARPTSRVNGAGIILRSSIDIHLIYKEHELHDQG